MGQRGDLDSTYSVSLIVNGSPELNTRDLVFNPVDGLLYVCAYDIGSALRIEANQTITVVPTLSGECRGLAFDRFGAMYTLASDHMQSSTGWIGWLDPVNNGYSGSVQIDDSGSVFVSPYNFGLVQVDPLRSTYRIHRLLSLRSTSHAPLCCAVISSCYPTYSPCV